ncbi:Epsin-3, clathrin recruitment and traffic between the Golgi and endosome [Allomyces arbusculus]|nr:Epsin-3, clathrin recruitment and traffic between the Golgi and endosome [Allomyces arbusculus]
MNLNLGALTSLDVHDIKSAFNKVKAAVLNLTELEQKVREATSNDAWGASTSLMNEIAQGTYDYQGFNEIMPAVYRRFSQDGHTWRNIYKALTLIEFLIKNGSDRCVDYIRTHTYEIKACLRFHHVDDKGKDQGVNVRHRAKLIIDLLQNHDLIKAERQKAQENRNKYGGVGSNGERSGGFGGAARVGGYASSSSSNYPGATSATTSSAQRYGGFGSEAYRSGISAVAAARSASAPTVSTNPSTTLSSGLTARDDFGSFQPPKPKAQAQVVDLLGFDDAPAPAPATAAASATADDEWGDFASANAPAATVTGARSVADPLDDEDEFSGFQAAPAAEFDVFGAVPSAAPAAKASAPTASLFDDDFGALVAAPTTTAGAIAPSPAFASLVPAPAPAPTTAAGSLTASLAGLSLSTPSLAPVTATPTLSSISTPSLAATPATPTIATPTLAPTNRTSIIATATSGSAAASPSVAAAPLRALFTTGLVNLDGLSLGSGVPTAAAGPSMNALMQSQATQQVAQAVRQGSAPLVPAPATAAAAAPPAPAKDDFLLLL